MLCRSKLRSSASTRAPGGAGLSLAQNRESALVRFCMFLFVFVCFFFFGDGWILKAFLFVAWLKSLRCFALLLLCFVFVNFVFMDSLLQDG